MIKPKAIYNFLIDGHEYNFSVDHPVIWKLSRFMSKFKNTKLLYSGLIYTEFNGDCVGKHLLLLK